MYLNGYPVINGHKLLVLADKIHTENCSVQVDTISKIPFHEKIKA